MPKISEHDVADTYETIAAATLRLAELHGYSGFTVRDVCRDAGVSIGAVYAHFGSKRNLIRDCIGGRTGTSRSVLLGLQERDGPLLKLNMLLREHMALYGGKWSEETCALDVAAWGEYLRDPEAAEPAVAELALLLATLYRIVRDGQRAGQVERHLFAPAAAEALAAVLLGLGVLRRLGWKFSPRRMADVLSLFLRGFEPGTGGPWRSGPGYWMS